jgi:hypothetical protein
MTNSNINILKRSKTIKKLPSFYLNHPSFETVKQLYLNNVIKSIASVEKTLNSIKVKKNGEYYKTSIKKVEKLEKLLKEFEEKQRFKQYEKETTFKDIELNYDNIFNFFPWIHTAEVKEAMKAKPTAYISHHIIFYEDNQEVEEKRIIINFSSYMTRKDISEKFRFVVYSTSGGDDWIVSNWIYGELENKNEDLNRSVILRTITAPKLDNENDQNRLIQIFKNNENNDCVYMGLVQFFEKYKDDKKQSRGYKIYKKLIKHKNKYSKGYNLDELDKLAKDLNISITIKDLINDGKDNILINKSSFNYCSVEFINTKYNHLDVKICENNTAEEVSEEQFKQLKKDSSFYIEKFNTLTTIEKIETDESDSDSDSEDGGEIAPANILNINYKCYKKADDEFNILFNKWKLDNNINGFKIPIKSDAFNFINQYDDKIHRFFDDSLKIDDALYNEIDMKKAFYNFYQCDEYGGGLPSGSFICVSGAGFTVDTFQQQFKNGLMGFYEIKIMKINKQYKQIFKLLGLTKNTTHILYSSMIKLIVNYAKLSFLNYCVSPSIDLKFNDAFLKTLINGKLYTSEQIEADEELKQKKGVKAYSKAVGIFGIDNLTQTTNIKALDADDDFYKTLTNKNIFKVEGVFKVVEPLENPTSLKHLAYAIKANVQTVILKQLLQFENPADIYGVKVDSIVYKKDAKFNIVDTYKELFKTPTLAKVEKMLKSYNTLTEQIETVSPLDYGLDNTPSRPTTATNMAFTNYKNSIRKQYDNLFNDDDILIMFNDYKKQFKNKRDDEDDEDDEEPTTEPIKDYSINNSYYLKYFISSSNKLIFDVSPLPDGEHITKKHLFLGGAGGAGKTYSILNSRIFMKNKILFSSNCWELIQGTADEFKERGICGLSLPKLTGQMNGQKVEKYDTNYFKYKAIDELTLNNNKTVETILKQDDGRCFIFLIGDIDFDGYFYQASISKDIFNPSKHSDIQYVKYLKSYRFDDELNDKLNNIRDFMRKGNQNPYLLYQEVERHFTNNFYNKDEIIFNSEDVGISALKPINENGECKFSTPFFKNGSIKQYYNTETKFKNKIYKGGRVESDENNKNITCSLFRTIHSYQGRQLNNGNNRIIILLNSLFDYNLLYTALSRARRVNQIVIINDLQGRDKQLLKHYSR